MRIMCSYEVGESVQPSSRFSGCVLALIFVSIFANARCLPLAEKNADETVNYLMKYGYLPASDIHSRNILSEDHLKGAIRELQRSAHIPITGKMDKRTEELMKSPRCGLPDSSPSSKNERNKRYALDRWKWSKTELTWSFRSRNNRENLDVGRVRATLRQALSLWSKNSKLSFHEANSNDADILMSFERGDHNDTGSFDSQGIVLAHAYSPGSGLGGDVHFNADKLWNVDTRGKDEGINLFEVAAHELGHSLGLLHSNIKGALMFPWFQGLKTASEADFQLPQDDRDAIQKIYGARNVNDRPPLQIPPKTERPLPPRPTESPRPPTSKPIAPIPPRRRPAVKTEPAGAPNSCDISYDAVSVIRGELFIFKNEFLWRFGSSGLLANYPALIRGMWNALPDNLTHVDAVYERPDQKIVFLIGQRVYVFSGTELDRGFPRPLTSLGLPSTLTHVDAAMVWGNDKKTYLFSGAEYWRIDDKTGRVEQDYPRDIQETWKGVENNIDAAFLSRDGFTYFFKEKGFWKFNDQKMRTTTVERMPSAPRWMMGCPKSSDQRTASGRAEKYINMDDGNISRYQHSIISGSSLIIGVAAAVVATVTVAVVLYIYNRKRSVRW